MAAIDDFIIPANIVAEFQQILQGIKPEYLLAYVKSRPDLVRGFRPNKSNLKIIVKRLEAMLGEAGELDLSLRGFLANESMNAEFVAVWSFEALEFLFRQFCGYYGNAFIAAVLLDNRQEVRHLAITYLQQQGGESGQEVDTAKALGEIKKKLSPFISRMADILAGEKKEAAPPFDEAENLKQLEQYRAKIDKLERKLEKDRGNSRIEKKLNEKLTARDKELLELQQTLARERESRKEAIKELDRKKEQLKALKHDFGSELNKKLEKELSVVLRGWLKTPLEIEKEVGKSEDFAGLDLLARSFEILKRQEMVDRHVGNRAIIKEQLRKLLEAKEQILVASREALNPMPELFELNKELERETSRLKALLGCAEEENPLVAKLNVRINAAANLKDLHILKEFLVEVEQMELLRAVELGRLYSAYQKKMDRVYDKYQISDSFEGAQVDPGRLLRQSIAKKKDFHLIVDGHNVLFGLPDIFSEYYEGGVPAVKARDRLLEIVDKMLADSASFASVFFDGAESSQSAHSSRVKQFFSGGGHPGVKNRADQAIVDYLFAIKMQKEKMPIIVVTSDTELRNLAKERGARIMPVRQFQVLVSDLYA